jgi:hypothetical protein
MKKKPTEKSATPFTWGHHKVDYPPAVRDLLAEAEKLRRRDLKQVRQCRDDAHFAKLAIAYLYRHFGSAPRLLGTEDDREFLHPDWPTRCFVCEARRRQHSF